MLIHKTNLEDATVIAWEDEALLVWKQMLPPP